jgi:hypothetical protein
MRKRVEAGIDQPADQRDDSEQSEQARHRLVPALFPLVPMNGASTIMFGRHWQVFMYLI